MRWRSNVDAFGEMVLYNPMVVPLTMATTWYRRRKYRHSLAGILGSLGFGIVMWILGSYVFNRYEAGAVKHL